MSCGHHSLGMGTLVHTICCNDASLQAIQIISPDNLTVLRNITTNNAGESLTSAGSVGGSSTTPIGWNDAVFVEVRIHITC